MRNGVPRLNEDAAQGMSLSIRTIACGDEGGSAFLWQERVADCADLSLECLVWSCGGFADQGFELGERRFDRVRIGRIGRQEDRVIALGAQQIDGAAGFVGRQLVRHDDLSRSQRRGEFGAM